MNPLRSLPSGPFSSEARSQKACKATKLRVARFRCGGELFPVPEGCGGGYPVGAAAAWPRPETSAFLYSSSILWKENVTIINNELWYGGITGVNGIFVDTK